MKLDIGYETNTGLLRDHNEDALGMWELNVPSEDGTGWHGWLLAVADGMGGHLAGEVASQLAIEVLPRAYEHHAATAPAAALRSAAEEANRAVWDAGQTDAAHIGMGTTLVAALLRAGLLVVAHVGDSPAFLVRDMVAHRLTRDHSWVAEAVARGQLDQEEAEQHPYRHVLTRALGSVPEVLVDLSEELTLEPDDVVVLCSDGLLRHVREEEMARVVTERSAQAAAETLVDLANERGGEDNITVIICRILS